MKTCSYQRGRVSDVMKIGSRNKITAVALIERLTYPEGVANRRPLHAMILLCNHFRRVRMGLF